MLRVPLLGKLLGANLLLALAATAAHFTLPNASTAMELGVLLSTSFVATAALVWLALRPIVALESVAHQVSLGDFRARVPQSRLADRDILRLSSTMNQLLDRVQTDRARIQYLAGRSVRARDIERESVARELRDSVAQTLAAISLQVAVAARANREPAVAEQLTQTREMVQQLTEEIRTVAETLYPGTLGEFGLANALRALARRVGRRSPITIEVEAVGDEFVLSPAGTAALYRAADESLRNVEQHANASQARLMLCFATGSVILAIDDDGRGFDMKTNDPLQAGLGLFSAKAVLDLAGGDLQIASAPQKGTRVVARVPCEHADLTR